MGELLLLLGGQDGRYIPGIDVCVLHIKPFFLRVDIQHNQCLAGGGSEPKTVEIPISPDQPPTSRSTCGTAVREIFISIWKFVRDSMVYTYDAVLIRT